MTYLLDRVLSCLEAVRRVGRRYVAKCPNHQDRHPSLSIAEGEDSRVLLKCFAGCTAGDICGAIGLSVSDLFPEMPGRDAKRVAQAPRARRDERGAPSFSRREAAALWAAARERARDDDSVDADGEVYRYLESRGLVAAWEDPGLGVISPGMELPASVSWWPRAGYRVVAPLYDGHGDIGNVQARSIVSRATRKVLFPAGGQTKGLVFANDAGRELLRGEPNRSDIVLFGEGLTDFLAIASVASCPVISVPGTGFAASAVGSWAVGARVAVATDCDDAGDRCAQALAPQLYRAGAGEVLRVVWPHDRKDACDVVEAIGIEGLGEFLIEHRGGSHNHERL